MKLELVMKPLRVCGRAASWLAVLAVLAGAVAPADAIEVVSLVGDKDGFGLPGGPPPVPLDGTLWRDGLGGVFFTDYRDAGDLLNAPFTDIWFADAAISYTHNYSLGGQIPISAALDIQIAGVANNLGPWDVFLNGGFLGQIPTNTSPNNFQEILLYTFAVNPVTLMESDAILLNINVPQITDGYSINFSELRITVIPEPSTLTLAGLGLLGLLAYGRRRRIRA